LSDDKWVRTLRVAGVGFEDATQIRFAEHQDVVEAFALDRAMSRSTCPFCHGERAAVG
jgi:hypothetical protein